MSTSFNVADSQIAISKLSVLYLGYIGRGWDPRQQLMTLVNGTSVRKYSLDAWDFTDIEKMPNGSRCNTSASIMSSVAVNGMFNKRRINYNRIHVADLGVIKIPKGSFVKVSDTLAAINSLLGTVLDESAIVDATLPDADVDGNVTINLVFVPDNIQFYSTTRVVLASDVPAAPFSKADIGLPLVDNTPDLQKPVSQPTAAAIDDALLIAKAYTRNQIAAIPASTPSPTPAPTPAPTPSPSGDPSDPTDAWHDDVVDGGNF